LVAALLLAASAHAATASAHGTAVPNATNYLASISHAPAGVEAKVIDGDLRMWMRVSPRETVEVLDYLGAPFLRFSRAGVAINRNSEMYYLDHVPVEYPPANVTAHTPPKWEAIGGGHEYTWVDGRLHALSSIALSPGTAYVGKWSIALLVNGARTKLGGGVRHASPPSIVWFWPIFVLIACALAVWRLRQRELDQRLGRVLSLTALCSLLVAALGKQLHGRPVVDAWQVIVLIVMLAVLLPAIAHAARKREPGYFFFFLVSMATVLGDFELIPTLMNGYVLIAVPALLARIAAVLCAGSGVGLLFVTFRLAEEPEGLHVGLARRRGAGATT
jgi:hypothetical protein